MIALFNTVLAATTASNTIQNYLTANRTGYNADKWSVSNKSAVGEKWAVKIPADIPQTLILNEVEMVSSMPVGWYPSFNAIV